MNSPEPLLFCIADQNQYSTIRLRDAADPQRETTLSDSMITVIIDDISPLVNVAGLLRTYGKNYRVLGESTTSLTDLRRSPSVFIGAFDNSWTLRLTSTLRFHFANNPEMTQFWIEDRPNPENVAGRWIAQNNSKPERIRITQLWRGLWIPIPINMSSWPRVLGAVGPWLPANF